MESEYIFYPVLFAGLIIASEIAGYFWHEIFAHHSIIPFVRETHQTHHNIIDDQAHGDFFYICFFLSIYFMVLVYLYYKSYITLILLVILFTGVFFPFLWSWYVHSAYHIENHWLNEYEWFRNDKRIHMQHHINPKCNFGIATHFTDEIMGTFDYAFPITQIENK